MTITSLENVDFYKKQMRVALRNCGVIDPENIDEYIALDGYKALAKVLTEMTPRGGYRRSLKTSGLRGRGGAGFPTGMKWQFADNAAGAIRNTSAATPTKATRARSWTAPFWRATRTPLSRPWPSPVTPSAPTRAISTSAPSTRSRYSVSQIAIEPGARIRPAGREHL